jgi:hypothetical protein
MNFAQSISALSQLGDQWKLLKATIIAATTATEASTVAAAEGVAVENLSVAAKVKDVVITKAVTAAQWAWNLAMEANPIGLIVVAVAAAGAAIYKLTQYLNESAEAAHQMEAETARIKANYQTTIDLNNELNSKEIADLKRAQNEKLEILKTSGASQKAINDLRVKQNAEMLEALAHQEREAKRQYENSEMVFQRNNKEGLSGAEKDRQDALKESLDASKQAYIAARKQKDAFQAQSKDSDSQAYIESIKLQKDAAKKAQEAADAQAKKEAEDRAKFRADFNAKLAADETNATAVTEDEKFKAARENERRALEASLKMLKFGNDEKRKMLGQFDAETALEQDALNKKIAAEQKKADDKKNAEALKSLETAKEDAIKARIDQIDFSKAKDVEELTNLVNKNILLLQELRDQKAREIELEDISTEEKKVKQETNNTDYITAVQAVADSEVAVKENFVMKTQDFNQRLMDSAQQVFDNAANLAGQETDLGKALLVAKQAVVAAELILNIKSMISNSQKVAADATIKAAGAGVDIATGAAKTASAAPFPANIPLIVGYAATAVGIIASIKAALKKTKGAADPTDSGSAAVGPVASAPTVSYLASSNNQLANTIQSSQKDQVIKAYVVSGDMTNQQSLDRNLVESTSI